MSSSTRDAAAQMTDAAMSLLESLDPDQRAIALWPFEDQAERERWFYTPTDHGGLTLSAMTPTQQRLAHRLLASGLSRAGYVTASTIIGLENVLDQLEGFMSDWGRERGRDPGLFYTRIFGDPAGEGPWSWRFGGHHVSVHHVILDGEVVGSTPLFLGADPASSPLLGPHPLRPLAGVEDLGRGLVRSLDEGQRRMAIVAGVAPVDLVGANRSRYGQAPGDLPLDLASVWRTRFEGELDERLLSFHARAVDESGLTSEHLEAVRLDQTPRGLAASAMSDDQRNMLRSLLDLYVGRLPDDLASLESIKYASQEALGGLAFMWAGGLEPGQGHYYRIQGIDILCEYDNTLSGANHVHSVWRDPHRDFGADPLAAHYRRSHA
ncbi:unannotated protein [freshwater metagenome]|uniref:Unannotated protein n=1 Tax=freshwater metagenome TaxID=449393 RepID=A0A6J7I807_9ZZZZ|nr:DUF3500 domain-containing protein [Actinomycetota bacterium]